MKAARLFLTAGLFATPSVAPQIFSKEVPEQWKGTSLDYYHEHNELPKRQVPQHPHAAAPLGFLGRRALVATTDNTTLLAPVHKRDAKADEAARRKRKQWVKTMECLGHLEECNHQCWLEVVNCRAEKSMTRCAEPWTGCKATCYLDIQRPCEFEVAAIGAGKDVPLDSNTQQPAEAEQQATEAEQQIVEGESEPADEGFLGGLFSPAVSEYWTWVMQLHEAREKDAEEARLAELEQQSTTDPKPIPEHILEALAGAFAGTIVQLYRPQGISRAKPGEQVDLAAWLSKWVERQKWIMQLQESRKNLPEEEQKPIENTPPVKPEQPTVDQDLTPEPIAEVKVKPDQTTVDQEPNAEPVAEPVAEVNQLQGESPEKAKRDFKSTLEEILKPAQACPFLAWKLAAEQPVQHHKRSHPRELKEHHIGGSHLPSGAIAGVEGISEYYTYGMDFVSPADNSNMKRINTLTKKRVNECWIEHSKCDHECIKARLECAKTEPIEDNRLFENWHYLHIVDWGKCFEEMAACLEPCKEQRTTCEEAQRQTTGQASDLIGQGEEDEAVM
jgi:hypothetical protein